MCRYITDYWTYDILSGVLKFPVGRTGGSQDGCLVLTNVEQDPESILIARGLVCILCVLSKSAQDLPENLLAFV